MTDFSKKTGDYISLSATDIKVIALTYMLEVRHVGSAEHLKKEPTMKKSVEFYKPGSDSNPNSNNLAGFYKPDDCDSDEEDLQVITVHSRILRPKFKYPAKIVIAFSHILAINFVASSECTNFNPLNSTPISYTATHSFMLKSKVLRGGLF